jgi:hypothetical protein
MEWLKAKQVAAMVGASVHEGVGAGDAAQPPEWVEAAPGATGLDWSGGDGQEPGLTIGTLEAATSARGAGQAVVAKIRDAVETPQDVREEEKQPELQMEREEPQQQRAAARVTRAAVVAAAGGGAA